MIRPTLRDLPPPSIADLPNIYELVRFGVFDTPEQHAQAQSEFAIGATIIGAGLLLLLAGGRG